MHRIDTGLQEMWEEKYKEKEERKNRREEEKKRSNKYNRIKEIYVQ
jgi:hypothetical protein